jgi:8-oxo-dGTP diphosphatase
MNKIRREIIKKMMHVPGLHFNELWDKEITSNNFAYHLKILEEDSLIEKKQERYYLTHAGKKYVVFIDGKSGKKSSHPLLCVVIIIIHEDRILMQQRKKEPFYDYWGFPGGKIESDQFILESAERELREETGLRADLSIRGLICIKTYNEGQQSFSHYIFIVRGDNPRGKLLQETPEGVNKWVKLDKVNELSIFPDIPKDIEVALGNRFTLLEYDRHIVGDGFEKNDKIKERTP